MAITELIRENIINFLSWNDKNGNYTDEDSKTEGLEPLTFEQAMIYFLYVLNEDLYYPMYENPLECSYEDAIRMARENNVYEKDMEVLDELCLTDDKIKIYKKIIDMI